MNTGAVTKSSRPAHMSSSRTSTPTVSTRPASGPCLTRCTGAREIVPPMTCSGSRQILAAASQSSRSRWWIKSFPVMKTTALSATSFSRTTTNRTVSRLVCARCCTSSSSSSHTFSSTLSRRGTRTEADCSKRRMSCGASYSQRRRTRLHATRYVSSMLLTSAETEIEAI